MKYLILIMAISLSGCSCCSEPTQYEQLPPVVTVTDRYIPIPEILIDGATAELTVESDSLLTFSDVFTDSTTGKKIEISGVIPKKKDKIHFTARVPKDSVKATDTKETITLKPIPKEDGFFDGVTLKGIGIFLVIVVGLAFLITVFSLFKKG